MRKQIVYFHEGAMDLLQRYFTLAELKEFVDGIVADNPGSNPNDVKLRMDGPLRAELIIQR